MRQRVDKFRTARTSFGKYPGTVHFRFVSLQEVKMDGTRVLTRAGPSSPELVNNLRCLMRKGYDSYEVSHRLRIMQRNLLTNSRRLGPALDSTLVPSIFTSFRDSRREMSCQMYVNSIHEAVAVDVPRT